MNFQNSRIWGPGSQKNPGIGRFPLRNRDFGDPKPNFFSPAALKIWPGSYYFEIRGRVILNFSQIFGHRGRVLGGVNINRTVHTLDTIFDISVHFGRLESPVD